MATDPYRVLGLKPGATGAEIKRAYRAMAKANHPDSAGEAALPRFLAIQAAYEQLAPPGDRGPGRSRAKPSPAEPWRADPDRARSTRTGARPRGGPAERGAAGAGGSAPGASASRPGAGPRSGAADGAPGGTRSGTGASGSPHRSPGTGPRRRSAKKATFGSTTYDEAHEAADATWQGAAWYGPSSGEYWTVNPREYADPRKHGPEYQARAADRAERARRSGAEAEATTGGRRREATMGETQAGAQARAAAEQARDQARHAAAAREQFERSRAGRAATSGPLDAEATGATGASIGTLLPTFDWSRLERSPYRRLLTAVAAWPPIGIVLAAAIGQATGCAVFAATCTREGSILPWVGQVIVILALLAVPVLARAFVGGTIGVALLAFPAVAVLSAGGATYDPTYGPASLAAVLAIGWVAGVGAMTVRIIRRRSVA